MMIEIVISGVVIVVLFVFVRGAFKASKDDAEIEQKGNVVNIREVSPPVEIMKDAGAQNVEIVINSTKLDDGNKIYEFVLDVMLDVVDAGIVEDLTKGVVYSIDNLSALKGALFELNHVRVNPKKNNREILGLLHARLLDSGVSVSKAPRNIKMPFFPLGELSAVVRFYVKADASVVFLSEAVQLRLV